MSYANMIENRHLKVSIVSIFLNLSSTLTRIELKLLTQTTTEENVHPRHHHLDHRLMPFFGQFSTFADQRPQEAEKIGQGKRNFSESSKAGERRI